MGRVDHEVDDEERVEGEGGQDDEPAQPCHISANHVGQWLQQFSR